ncbi:MAG: hypothetical protein GY822_06970 [Deltaproteobacteria bacterium]|nr:hypothetical protein [Deltaproteobacteria bacterium]
MSDFHASQIDKSRPFSEGQSVGRGAAVEAPSMTKGLNPLAALAYVRKSAATAIW